MPLQAIRREEDSFQESTEVRGSSGSATYTMMKSYDYSCFGVCGWGLLVSGGCVGSRTCHHQDQCDSLCDGTLRALRRTLPVSKAARVPWKRCMQGFLTLAPRFCNRTCNCTSNSLTPRHLAPNSQITPRLDDLELQQYGWGQQCGQTGSRS